MICGLLGEKLGHSYSQIIHQQLGRYDYQMFSIKPNDLDDFFADRRFDGINVTIPYKKKVMRYCDHLSPLAKRVGCINVIVRDSDGHLYGDNCDYQGFIYLLNANHIKVADKKILILGNGATAATISAAVEDCGACKIVKVSRSGEFNYQNINEQKDAEIIINTTPVGMYPYSDGKLIDISAFPAVEAVVDLIYNPLCSRLLFDAREMGLPHASGLSMLVAQAKKTAELFIGLPIADERIEQIINDLRHKISNIVLIGMPGCGKSAIGAELARLMGREIVDSDQMIAESTGKTAAELIINSGEESFRSLEMAALASAGQEHGLIIATGGGAVLKEQNHFSLACNGRIYFIERDLSLLDSNDRPLSASTGIEQLYLQRLPFYRHFADVSIENDSNIESVANNIMEDFYENISN